jgi:hypothetical protein
MQHCVSEWAVEEYRVEQLASILTNLCLVHSFLPLLSSHNGVLRFLLLATHSSVPAINATAMDVLLSLARSLPLTSPTDLPMDVYPFLAPPLPELLFNCMLECVHSNDRMVVLKGELVGVVLMSVWF